MTTARRRNDIQSKRASNSRRPIAEVLEGRELLAAGIVTTYPVPTSGGSPISVTSDGQGTIWFSEGKGGKVGFVDPSGHFHEFVVPSGSLQIGGITADGSEGGYLFTETDAHKIGLVNSQGHITEYSLPTPTATPGAIVSAGYGDNWFTETDSDPLVPASQRVNKIGEFKFGGDILEFPLPAGDEADALASSTDGNVWFVDGPGNAIGRITPAGVVTEFPIPTAASGAFGITAGTDGNLWFTESAAHKIGEITTSGQITEYTLTTPGASPTGITSGPDGEIWFTETTASGPAIGRISPLNGSVTEFSLPAGVVAPTAITSLDANSLAFADPSGNLLGKISIQPGVGYETLKTTPQPSVTEFQGMGAGSIPLGSFVTSIGHPSASDFSATIDWGDGTPVTSGVVAPPSYLYGTIFTGSDLLLRPGTAVSSVPSYQGAAIPAPSPYPASYWGFSVNGAHTYAQTGTFSIHVTVTDEFGRTTTLTTTANVSAEPFTLVPHPISYVSGSLGSDNDIYYTVADVYAPSNGDTNPSDYTATVNWGDGTTTTEPVEPDIHVINYDQVGTTAFSLSPPGSLPNSSPLGTIGDTHVFPGPGDYTISIKVTDKQGHTETTSTVAHITALPGLSASTEYFPEFLANGTPQSHQMGGVSVNAPNADPADYTATIAWGDGSTTTGTLVATSNWWNTRTTEFTVLGAHAYAHAGTFSFTITVTKNDGTQSVTQSGSATVDDPTQFTVSNDYDNGITEVNAGDDFHGVVANIFSFNPAATPTDFTATIDWGDGSAPTAGVVAVGQYSVEGLTVSGDHTYAHPGSYTAKITITSVDGKMSQALASFTVSAAPTNPIIPPPVIPPVNNPVPAPVPVTILPVYIKNVPNLFDRYLATHSHKPVHKPVHTPITHGHPAKKPVVHPKVHPVGPKVVTHKLVKAPIKTVHPQKVH